MTAHQPTSTNVIVKYADDNTMVGLISDGGETVYWAEMENVSGCCSENSLKLNILQTKELIMDFRRHGLVPSPLIINGELVEPVSTFRFLDT